MIDYLNSKDYFEPITGVKSKGIGDKDWAKLDWKVMVYLNQWVDDNIYHHVSKMQTSKVIWKKASRNQREKHFQ